MPKKTHSDKLQESSFIQKFTRVSIAVGNQVYLRTLRDAFVIILPVFIIGGLGVMLNNTVFLWLFEGETLAKWQVFGNAIANGSLNVTGILVAPMIGYCLAKNKGFDNAIAAAAMALTCTFIVMPNTISLTNLAGKAVEVTGGVSYAYIGTQGMFGGIIVGLLSTVIFMRLASIKKLQIRLGDQVPPAVSKSFNVLIPALILMSIFAAITALLAGFLDSDLISLVRTWIQEPLRSVNTSLPGYLLLLTLGDILWSFGIHAGVVFNSLVDPLALLNMNQNIEAFANHEPIPNIITTSFISNYAIVGGCGWTISLIIAIFVFSKSKASKQIAGLAIGPGLFNINEPMIFGFPIVFNLPMMIPFVLIPSLNVFIGYVATAMGLVSKTVMLVPWTTPPLIGPYLSTAGDWRSVVLQGALIILAVFIYQPFLRMSERVAQVQAEQQENELEIE